MTTTLTQSESTTAIRPAVETVALRLVDDRNRPWEVALPVGGDGETLFAGTLGLLKFEASVRVEAENRRVRVEVTVHNPRRARHRGGLWDLGDPGSVLVRELSLMVPSAEVAGSEAGRIEWIEHPGGDVRSSDRSLTIYQESSGGENWDSRNHINRNGDVPMTMRGYCVQTSEGDLPADESARFRANPAVALVPPPGRPLARGGGSGYIACALEEFWQQFPSAISADRNGIKVSFWPAEFPDLHELQAGEKNTRVVWLQTGEADGGDWRTLEEVHDPSPPEFDRQESIQSGIVPFLPQENAEPRAECRRLLAEALEGEQSFFAKREVVDEYGWRNFGDMWADHEEAYCEDPRPVISHYNNQYDLLYGLLVQYVLTRDARWWRLADPLARHILDIDIYHTDRDKPAYNGGLFWHTNHYHDAGRCTHRTYSAEMLGKSMPSAGGGPGNEHNYATGLLLYHNLTGDRRAKQAVIDLADWVIAMDDGRRHVLGVLSSQSTGAASSTAMADYHGPGRGAGNSINTLLDGWLASGDGKYLTKLDELIRRTIHPNDDLAERDLGNAELRWSYTVHLQAIIRFLELTTEQDNLRELREYARAALLHYAEWMADNEAFYLDAPEQLEYPTETWAAQELRKGVVLRMAASHTGEEKRRGFIDRGDDLLDGAWERLMRFESRSCTRPLALVLQQCYLEAVAKAEGERDPSPADPETNIVVPFESQRSVIKKKARTFRGIVSLSLSLLRPRAWLSSFAQLWMFGNLRGRTDRPRADVTVIIPDNCNA